MLHIKNLIVRRNDFFSSIASLDIGSGECAALCGVSGSGKSTLLEAIGLLTDSFSCDRFRLKGIDIRSLSSAERQDVRTSLVGIMPQNGGLIPYLSVEESLQLQLKCALRKRAYADENGRLFFDKSRVSSEKLKEYTEELKDTAEVLGIADHLHKKPKDLSAGQRQRALFLRAVAQKPALVLADEPTSSLDPDNAKKLFDVLENAAVRRGTAVLIVTHDLESSRRFRRYVYDKEASKSEASVFTQEIF